MSKAAEIDIVSVSKVYGTTTAVHAISLKIPAGSYCCFLGPSGCGKTSTLRMIAGHEGISSGDIRLGNTVVTDFPPARRGTAMMFQSYALFPHLDLIDNVAFSLKMKGVDKDERRAKALEMLKAVLRELDYRNLDDLADFRGRNTTTEFLAGEIHRRLKARVAAGGLGPGVAGYLASLRVVLRESPIAWAAFEGPLG